MEARIAEVAGGCLADKSEMAAPCKVRILRGGEVAELGAGGEGACFGMTAVVGNTVEDEELAGTGLAGVAEVDAEVEAGTADVGPLPEADWVEGSKAPVGAWPEEKETGSGAPEEVAAVVVVAAQGEQEVEMEPSLVGAEAAAMAA